MQKDVDRNKMGTAGYAQEWESHVWRTEPLVRVCWMDPMDIGSVRRYSIENLLFRPQS